MRLPLAFALLGAAAALTLVDLTSVPSIPTQIAVQTCAGLRNRGNTTSVFVLHSSQDSTFLADVAGVTSPPAATPVSTFLKDCLLGDGKVAAGVLRFNYTAQKAQVPVLITLGGVLDAVPLEANDPAGAGVPVVLDAVSKFMGMPTRNVTAYVYDNFANRTTSLAFMDPGYNQQEGGPLNPKLTGDPKTNLIDFIVKQRLFNFYLVEACVPGTEDHALVERMVSEDPATNSWPRPIAAYGYDDVDKLFGGDLFEAGANCVKEHNLGTVASNSCPNLSFFSQKPDIQTPLRQVPSPHQTFNASRSYVTFVVGDGDNLGYDFGGRFFWMQNRVTQCANKSCYPLVWTVSPHLLTLAPDLARWFYNQSYITGAEYFALPPSGFLYTYPASMNDVDSARYVELTNGAARLMNTSATVDWETPLTWEHAFSEFFTRYGSVVKGIFPLNVPYMVPTIPFFGEKDTYRILQGAGGEPVVVFQPREWRGGNDTGAPPLSKHEYFTPTQMAAELNGNPPGTVSHIYLTSDGGGNLGLFDALVDLLHEHVQVVDANTAISMAVQRGQPSDV